jgi:hypothetical protein
MQFREREGGTFMKCQEKGSMSDVIVERPDSM